MHFYVSIYGNQGILILLFVIIVGPCDIHSITTYINKVHPIKMYQLYFYFIVHYLLPTMIF